MHEPDATAAFDGGPPDAESADARNCPLQAEVPAQPPPVWEVTVAYDEVLETSASAAHFEAGVRTLFADAEGASVFTSSSFVRAGLDGRPIDAVAYPNAALVDAVATPDAYGATMQFTSTDYRLCIFDRSGVVSGDDCLRLANAAQAPWLAWNAGKFHIADLNTETHVIRIAEVDETGVLVQTRDILPLGSLLWGVAGVEPLGDSIALSVPGLHATGCATLWTSRLAGSGVAADPIDALPDEYEPTRLTHAAAPGVALFLYTGRCRQSPEECDPGYPMIGAVMATMLTTASPTPTTVVTNLPIETTYSAVWDGESVALLTSSEPLRIFLLAEDGSVQAQASLALAYDGPDAQLISASSIAALGPRDYLVGYTVSWPGLEEHRLARVAIEPPSARVQ